jgi:thiol-disulfide isomerase/thioredoxin
MTRRKVTRTGAGGQRGGGGRSTLALVAAVVGVIALVALFAVVLTSGKEDTSAARPVSDGTDLAGPVTVTGDALPDFGDDPDPAVGLAAPAVSGEDFAGDPVSIAADGRAKAIVFLAHWCPHCQAEVPVIQEWLDAQGMPADVDLYSVATAIDPASPNYPPDEWLAREGWTVPVLVDDGSQTAATAFGLTSFPYFVFVDAQGNVTGRAAGELSIEELQGYLATAG